MPKKITITDEVEEIAIEDAVVTINEEEVATKDYVDSVVVTAINGSY